MALRTNQKQLQQHLCSLGIPEPYAEKYATTFVEQDVTPELLKLVSDSELRDTYQIELGGHRLRIRHGASQFQSQQTNEQPISMFNNKPNVRHNPPQLHPKMTPSSFRAFKSHWEVYKGLVGIPPNTPGAAAQIFSLCCNDHPQIRQNIADHNPEHLNLTESDYLHMLCRLLTAQAIPETYRSKFFSMNQNAGETCQQWLQRLQEVAPDCAFSIPCNKTDGVFHQFDKNLLRSKFILGLHDSSIKQDLLAKCSDLNTLEDVFNYATRIEATTRDMRQQATFIAGIVINTDNSSSEDELNRISSYKKLKKAPYSKNNQRMAPRRTNDPCAGCGSTQHVSTDRSSKCPAFKKTCNRCGKRGHFANVCRSSQQTDTANAVIACVREKANQSSEIKLMVTPTSRLPQKGLLVDVYPDTGASLSVVGPFILKKFGIGTSCLKSTTRNIVTANGGKINCIGTFKAVISINDRSSIQTLYVCKNIRRFFLSKEGCIALAIVHKGFPQPLATSSTPKTSLQLTPDKPKSLPFPPTAENIPNLKKYLLEAFSKTAFNSDKDAYFPAMVGVPKARIHLKADAEPAARRVPNRIPYFWQDATKALLDQHVKRGIIAKAPVGQPTPWCSPMVITPKKSNTPTPKLRMTVDLQGLNSQCIRELHHVETPFKLASRVPSNTYKTLLDAVDGYQAVELDKESQSLTTFITPWGPYYFLRLPAGLIDSGDKYTSRYDLILQNIKSKVKCVDDTLLFDTNITDAFYHTFDFLQTCSSRGIVLNAAKFQFCQKEITFAGFKITADGIKPSDSTLSALREFPTPKSTTDVRSWFGLVRQVAYVHSVSKELAPFRCLLKHDPGKKPVFVWNAQLQQAFEDSKRQVVNSVTEGIKTFDPKRLTFLQCDWSKRGIGFLLLQKHCDCKEPDPLDNTITPCCPSGWKTVYAGSRFTNSAESNYAPTEGEALAVSWALKSSRLFTLGCPNLHIITDHKPLLGILNKRDLGSIKNPRIRRLKEQTLDFQFYIKHCPGKFNDGADALSRYPAKTPLEVSAVLEEFSDFSESEVKSTIQHAINTIGTISNPTEGSLSTLITLEKVELACVEDSDYMELHSLVASGFPDDRGKTPSSCKLFWPLAQDGLLSTFGNIVLYKDRIVIPKSLRSYVIRVLHSAHQGCTGMVARAVMSVYWPGIRKDILNHQTNCHSCVEISPSQPREPLLPTAIPDRPFQVLCSDIFQLNNRFYLIIVDRFSGFLHIFYSRIPPTHKFLEQHFRDVFIRYGRPDELETDGGPQYKSMEFMNFLKFWNVKHRVSSPYYPQSNGRAELGVKTAKRLLRTNTGPNGSIDNNEVACAVLQYHNTPLQGCPMSPSQLLFGRSLADFLPVNPKAYHLHPYWEQQIEATQSKRITRLRKTASKYNIGTKPLMPLRAGQTVVIQNQATKRWDRSGTITKVLPHRKYQLKLKDTGNITNRNRRFLKPKNITECHSRPFGPWISPKRPLEKKRVTSSPGEVREEMLEPSLPERTTSQQQTQIENDDSQVQMPLHSDIGSHSQRSTDNHQTTSPEATATAKEKLAVKRLRDYNHRGLRE